MEHIEIDAARLIQYWLYEAGWTQKHLADKLGVKKSRVTHMVGADNMRTDTLTRLAFIFEVSPCEFIRPAETNYMNSRCSLLHKND